MSETLKTTGKPRKRTIAKLYGIEKAKARYLDCLADIGSVPETREMLGIPWKRITYWLGSDPVFRDKYDEISARQREAHKRQVGTLVPPSLELLGKVIRRAVAEVDEIEKHPHRKITTSILKEGIHGMDKVLSSEGIIQEPVEKHDVLGAIKVEIEYVNRNRNPDTDNTPPTPLLSG